jgi:hypothetical protein
MLITRPLVPAPVKLLLTPINLQYISPGMVPFHAWGNRGMTIVLEVGDIRRFAQVGNFASYCRRVSEQGLNSCPLIFRW